MTVRARLVSDSSGVGSESSELSNSLGTPSNSSRIRLMKELLPCPYGPNSATTSPWLASSSKIDCANSCATGARPRSSSADDLIGASIRGLSPEHSLLHVIFFSSSFALSSGDTAMSTRLPNCLTNDAWRTDESSRSKARLSCASIRLWVSGQEKRQCVCSAWNSLTEVPVRKMTSCICPDQC